MPQQWLGPFVRLKKKSPVISFTVRDYVHQCSSMSPQSVLNVVLKTARAYDSDVLGKAAAASDCGTVNIERDSLQTYTLVTLELYLYLYTHTYTLWGILLNCFDVPVDQMFTKDIFTGLICPFVIYSLWLYCHTGHRHCHRFYVLGLFVCPCNFCLSVTPSANFF